MTPLLHCLSEIQQCGLNIHTVYDIGACKGEWSQTVQTHVLPNAEFILFEANPAYELVLSATGFAFFTAVLSNPGRESVEFYNGTNTGDSYYKETTAFYDNQGSVRLKCETLDEMVADRHLPIPSLIKLDTQGSELDILAGAESFLDQVDLIYTECPIVRYNAGAPNIQDYLDYFRAHKFLPIRLPEAHGADNILVQVDILFMRAESKEKYLGATQNVRPWLA